MAYLRALPIVGLFALFLAACGSSPAPEQGWGNGAPGSDPATGSGTTGDGDQADPGVVRSGSSDGGTTAPSTSTDGGTATTTTTVATIPCTSPNACANARNIGSVAGDATAGGNQLRAQGKTSEWLVFRVLEAQHAPNGTPLSVKVTMFSPSGTNFDVSLFVNTADDLVSCTAPASTSTSTGSTDSVSASWGESGRFANADDDSRWVSLHIQQVSGACSSTAGWNLLIEGGVL